MIWKFRFSKNHHKFKLMICSKNLFKMFLETKSKNRKNWKYVDRIENSNWRIEMHKCFPCFFLSIPFTTVVCVYLLFCTVLLHIWFKWILRNFMYMCILYINFVFVVVVVFCTKSQWIDASANFSFLDSST